MPGTGCTRETGQCIVQLSAHTQTTKHQIIGYAAPAAHCIFLRRSPFIHAHILGGQFSGSPAVGNSGVYNTCWTFPSLLTTTNFTYPSEYSRCALIPPKLVCKILKREFIEMREMFPNAWVMNDQPISCCCSSKLRRGKLVMDIHLWVEGYASLVAVLTTKHPDKAPHFMAYLETILHVSRNFEGSAWASYDAEYWRKATSTQSFN